jgi:putative sterol carrier protein
MAFKFGTDAWIKALMDEINSSEAYRKAAKSWEGAFYFVIAKGINIPEDIYMYMDLWHGECRKAYKVADPSQESPAFILSGALPIWRKVLEKKADPIRSMMTRQLKLKGNMMQIMKVPKAATELVECCTRIETEWPA